MNIKDGYALQLAIKRGYRVIIISGGNSDEVRDRLLKLGVTEVYMQVENKAEVLKSLMQTEAIESSSILFMGDDIPDLSLMQMAGVACCPSDAVTEIREKALYISHLEGGQGCARDVIEKVMKLRGHWSEDVTVRSR